MYIFSACIQKASWHRILMTKKIVISQPYFFPWVGLFEQLRLSDIFVHYDDVQFTKGGFINRVQIKTLKGFKWLTIPLKNVRLGQLINEIETDDKKDWRSSHYDFLKQVYAASPYKDQMLGLVDRVYWQMPFDNFSELLINGIEEVARYYGFVEQKQFLKSSELNIGGKSTDRVLKIVRQCDADVYITGMGALKYFDFALFEENDIAVHFMDYQKQPYNQLYGTFNPYVSILDLIANQGPQGEQYICSNTSYWKQFVETDTARNYLKDQSK